MPKKTRRAKILAKERRLRLLQNTPSPALTQVKTKQEEPEANRSLPTPTAPNSVYDETRGYFISDFKKSLLYIGIVIALEIVVYFGTINNYFKF